eukprot:538877-Prorocentrum_minimum.AAC.2
MTLWLVSGTASWRRAPRRGPRPRRAARSEPPHTIRRRTSAMENQTSRPSRASGPPCGATPCTELKRQAPSFFIIGTNSFNFRAP